MPDRVQPLTLDDLPDCLALARDREWVPEERKWRLLFEIGAVYGMRTEAGELAGSVILTKFGTELAVVGMLLVATRYGRQGIGGRLMARVLAEAGDATVFLYATRHGRPLYETLDFVATGTTYTYVGPLVAGGAGMLVGAGAASGVSGVVPLAAPTGPGGPGRYSGSRLAGPGDVPAIRRLDAEVNGIDRARMLDWLFGTAEQIRVIERRGRITGYGAALPNAENVSLGPVIAANVADAEVLISDLAAEVDGPVRLDLDGRHPELRAWASAHGVALRSSTTTMVRDGRQLPGDRSRWFAPLILALG